MDIIRKQFYSPDQPLVKVVGQDDDHTTILVLPTPFGSPDNKDFHGHYFDSETYCGDDIITTKFGLYEHFMNDLSNPMMAKMGKHQQILGPATLKTTDDAGRWFEIEVARSKEYHDVLIELIEKGLMGASTQAFMNSVEIAKDGRIITWVENEVSLTPTPANKNTIGAVYEVVKAFSGLPAAFSVVKNNELVVLDDDSVVELSTEESETPDDFETELENILEGEVETDGDEVLPGDTVNLDDDLQKALQQIIREEVKAQISIMMDVWGSDWEEIRGIMQEMMGKSFRMDDEQHKELMTGLDKLQKGFLHFARWSKAATVVRVGPEYEEFSQSEREALMDLDTGDQKRLPVPSSVIPAGAPGSN